jgi:uracil phosphoribosyltransferase
MTLEAHEPYLNFFEIKHPIIQYKLALLRDKNTNRKLFKELTEEIALLLGYEATAHLPMTTRTIHTPLESFEGPDLKNNQFVIAPILRAGLGMADGLLKLLSMACVGHLGLYRDEKTFEAKSYYFKLPPNCQDAYFFLCDPMLATGNTACAAIAKLKEFGIKNMTFICIVAAPEGLQQVLALHPDIPVFAAALDRELNENKYILPGLGDAGDRLWNVK